jgi:hypothetical protein
MRTLLLGKEGESVDALYHWRYFDTGIGIDTFSCPSCTASSLRVKGVQVVGR